MSRIFVTAALALGLGAVLAAGAGPSILRIAFAVVSLPILSRWDGGWRLSPVSRSLLFLVCFGLGWTGMKSNLRKAVDFRARTLAGSHVVAGRIGTVQKRGSGRRRTVLEIETIDGRPASGRIILFVYGWCPELISGGRVRVRGDVGFPRSASNPGEFDYRLFLDRQGIGGFLSAGGGAVEAVDPPGLLFRWRKKVLDHSRRLLHTLLPTDVARLVRACLLGDRYSLSESDRDAFRRSGTAHFLALSGLHVAILGASIFFVVGRFGSQRVAVALSTLLISVYLFLVGYSPSVVRASLMLSCYFVGFGCRRRPDGPSLLAGAATVLLLADPAEVLRLGFQLSFVAVLGIYLLHRPLVRLLGGTGDSPIRDTMRDMGALSFSAWVATVPLIATSFGACSLLAVPMGVVAAPLVSILVAGGFALLVIGSVSLHLALLPAGLVGLAGSVLLGGIRWLGSLDGVSVRALTPGPLWIVAFYLGLLLLVRWGRHFRPWTRRGMAVGFGCLILLGFLPGPRVGHLRITRLDMGDGSCLVLEAPPGEILLFDCGSGSRRDVGERIVRPFLRKAGLPPIGLLFVSHASPRHGGGVRNLLEGGDVGGLCVPRGFNRRAYGRRILAAARRAEVPIRFLVRGDRLQVGACDVEVLRPLPDGGAVEGLVLRVRFGERAVWLVGGRRDAPPPDDPGPGDAVFVQGAETPGAPSGIGMYDYRPEKTRTGKGGRGRRVSQGRRIRSYSEHPE